MVVSDELHRRHVILGEHLEQISVRRMCIITTEKMALLRDPDCSLLQCFGEVSLAPQDALNQAKAFIQTFLTPIRLMNVLKIPSSELNLKAVLLNGQSFRWRNIEDAFYGVVEGLLLYIRRLDNEQVEWCCLGRATRSENIDVATKLHKYFQLDVSLTELWKDWCDRDPFMTQLKDIKELHGIRILKQEPLETLLAFICSANNNIPRISGMVNKLAKLYGDPIVVESPTQTSHVLERFPELSYAFPTLSQLAAVQDELTAVLREQQFGYRANYVSGTVRQLSDMSPNILLDVQTLPCDEIRKFLHGFSGVGPKVAECVALMSFGQNQCVPVDRHVFEITKKYFLPALKDSSLTDALNRRILEFYEEKFGAYAGWAQAVLFNQQLEKLTAVAIMEKVKTKKTKSILKPTRSYELRSKSGKNDEKKSVAFSKHLPHRYSAATRATRSVSKKAKKVVKKVKNLKDKVAKREEYEEKSLRTRTVRFQVGRAKVEVEIPPAKAKKLLK
ncbi:hypothetical protein Y032_0268g801 [Ancylostoma ceylanicum]|uniref:DNA-(apurinic or apyrimidinic site) lyase n=1 Tax=Ancylostoma ceylanicum TaxID=53326 RepID=A0A016S9V6_9BILA|nr:hypothetical protein Y032_0268g801 [Ancylostoma ceylanicum]